MPLKEPKNPYLGFGVTVGSYRFHCSPTMLTVWKDGRLVDGPTRIGYVPRTNQHLIDIGLDWIKRVVTNGSEVSRGGS